MNGAWCCQHSYGMDTADWLLTADDLPATDPVWPDALVIQFACWGYGTPTMSTFSHWAGTSSEMVSAEPFVAAIPKRLLANPRGPLGYIGHVDTAWLHGFDDPGQPIPDGLYHPRLEPLLTLVERAFLLRTAAGFGLGDLSNKASAIASQITSFMNRLRRDGLSYADLDAAQRRDLADGMIRRNDAAWFMMFGDPGVRVVIGD